MSTLKSQIEIYKKQIAELHEKMSGDELKMKKLEFEWKQVEETCRSLTNEKNRLQSELESVVRASGNDGGGSSGTSLIGRLTRSPTLDEHEVSSTSKI